MSKVISKNSAEHYVWGNNCDAWHLLKSKNLSVIQEQVPQGSSENKHFHNKAEQFFYILSGVATMEYENQVYVLHKNEGVHIPAGIMHKLSNKHQSDLEFIVISTPPSHGDRVVVKECN